MGGVTIWSPEFCLIFKKFFCIFLTDAESYNKLLSGYNPLSFIFIGSRGIH